ncbi:site-specific DNA-methyltransferase [Alkalicella caledoniensis]|uniref:Site-specific DNA-methyltransferase n=2 Tax=Alkalicella caledoniensis TaxID=2731377 RepID=A0A7G9WD48_ALKCA|nr:site-specific DNA-methyltransferase [Alkalicella caledoniensis]
MEKQDKLTMHTANIADANFSALAKMFPNAVTETVDENGEVIRAIDAEVLAQEINTHVVSGKEERYQFTWPDKKKSVLLANAPIAATLRPSREESVDFDKTENLYIEGDNLDVLKLLRETYLNRVKMIYIDPPYNTGKDFIYEDHFTEETDEFLHRDSQYDDQGNRLTSNFNSNGRYHTDWLNMLYPRLRVARDVLAEDGVIFISIDDNEVDNLKKICDEIFGEHNFIARVIHKNNSMKNQTKLIGVTTEYMLIYAKSKTNISETVWRIQKKGSRDIATKFEQLKRKGLSLDEITEEIKELYTRPKYAHLSRWNKVDEKGVFKDADLSRENGPKNYTIINPTTGKNCTIPRRGWGKSLEELERLQELDLIWYGDDSTPPGLKDYIEIDDLMVPDNFWYFDSSVDTRWQKKVFGSLIFENPKPLDMLKQIVNIHANDGDIVLDFFSGSSTTAHAVMQNNSEDGGKRKYIMVQLPEPCDEKSVAYKSGFKNICEIGKERIRRAGAKIKEEAGLTTQNLDTGFRVLKLDSSNMKEVYYTPEEYSQMGFNLEGFMDNIKPDRTNEDLLFQVMLDLGIPLSAKIEQSGNVYNVNDNYLIACFDRVDTAMITEIAKKQPYYAVFRDSSFMNDSALVNVEQIFNTYSPSTIRRVL